MSANPKTIRNIYDQIEQETDVKVDYELEARESTLEIKLSNNETGLEANLEYNHENSGGGKPGSGSLELTFYRGNEVVEQSSMSASVSRRDNMTLGHHKDTRRDLEYVLNESIEFAEELISQPSSIDYKEIVDNSLAMRTNEAYDMVDNSLSERNPDSLSAINDLDRGFRTTSRRDYDDLKDSVNNSDQAEAWRELGERLVNDDDFNMENYKQIRSELEDSGFNTSITDLM